MSDPVADALRRVELMHMAYDGLQPLVDAFIGSRDPLADTHDQHLRRGAVVVAMFTLVAREAARADIPDAFVRRLLDDALRMVPRDGGAY